MTTVKAYLAKAVAFAAAHPKTMLVAVVAANVIGAVIHV